MKKKHSKRKRNRMPAALRKYWAARKSNARKRRPARPRRRNAAKKARGLGGAPRTMTVSNRKVALELVRAMRKLGYRARLVTKKRSRKK